MKLSKKDIKDLNKVLLSFTEDEKFALADNLYNPGKEKLATKINLNNWTIRGTYDADYNEHGWQLSYNKTPYIKCSNQRIEICKDETLNTESKKEAYKNVKTFFDYKVGKNRTKNLYEYPDSTENQEQFEKVKSCFYKFNNNLKSINKAENQILNRLDFDNRPSLIGEPNAPLNGQVLVDFSPMSNDFDHNNLFVVTTKLQDKDEYHVFTNYNTDIGFTSEPKPDYIIHNKELAYKLMLKNIDTHNYQQRITKHQEIDGKFNFSKKVPQNKKTETMDR